MARKKKKKRRLPEHKTSKDRIPLFNPAFKKRITLEQPEITGVTAPEKASATEHKKKPDENQYFLSAMADVEPLNDFKSKITRPPDTSIRPAHPAPDDELEAMAHLSDLVSGTAEMDITFSDEYIEGSVHGFDRKLLERLKKGEFPVQDYVDLHGLTKQEAELRIRDFLLQSHRMGLRCVLVVHGRGLNSENQIPVLKERLPVWLSRGPVKRIVLAFSTARSYDGGTGAIYVLLRKRKGVI
ncbi:MAG: Smr/MutS family protein [Desulfatiglandaceae bacterium]|jgi:DNA-nicking Smr family endonuclease